MTKISAKKVGEIRRGFVNLCLENDIVDADDISMIALKTARDTTKMQVAGYKASKARK